MVDRLAQLGTEALHLAIWLSLPLLACALVVAAVLAVIQAWTQLQEPALSALPRLLAVGTVLLASLAWVAQSLHEFTEMLWQTLAAGAP